MSEIHGATGSYVINALDPDELDEFEAHLAVCPACRHEIVEFCETAAELSFLAAAPPPPVGLRDLVLSGIAEVRPLPPLDGPPRRAVPWAEDRRDLDETVAESQADTAFAASTAAADPVVDELALRRSYRRTRVLTLMVAAVTVIALALGGVVVSLVQSQKAPITSASQVDPSLLSAPDAKIYTKKLVNGAHVSFVVSKSQDRAVFVSTDLPSVGPDKKYQLWTLQDKAVRPDNLLDGGPDRTQAFAGPISTSTALAVTIEPAAGSTTPTAPIQASTTI